jgi:dUTP pyrophosphatase
MKIPAKRFDTKLPLPEYEPLAAGFDFVCRENVVIKPQQLKTISANIAMAIPKGYTLLVVPRSSTPHRFGLSMPHSIGIVDPFYNGSDDELVLLFYNFTSKTVKVKRGDKIAQGILVKYEAVEFDESKALKKSHIGKWKKPKRRQ